MNRTQSDSGKFRTALKRAGWGGEGIIFSDPRKTTRRLKLWFATAVFDDSQEGQRKLEKELKAQFGTRYLTGYFINAGYWCGGGKSLCIRLAKK